MLILQCSSMACVIAAHGDPVALESLNRVDGIYAALKDPSCNISKHVRLEDEVEKA